MDIKNLAETNATSVALETDELLSNSVSQPKLATSKFRIVINKVVNCLFPDLTKACTDISSSSNLHNFRKLIKCFQNCSEELSQMFVCLSAHTAQNLCLHSVSAGSHCVAHAFTRWLLSQLCYILSIPSASVIHEECGILFFSVMQVVQARDPENFRRYVLQFILFLKDLISYEKNVDSNNCSNFINEVFPCENCTKLQIPEGLNLKVLPIVISSYEECEMLQIKLLMLLRKLISGVALCIPDCLQDLCRLLCLQIEIGTLHLKEEALMTVSSLISSSGILAIGHELFGLFDCFQALILFCCSSHETFPSNHILVEKAVASCLFTVMEALCQSKVVFNFSIFFLSKTLEDILQTLIKYGFSSLKSHILKSTVVMTACLLILFLEVRGFLLPCHILQQFKSSLLLQFENSENHELLIFLVTFLIALELNESTVFIPEQINYSAILNVFQFSRKKEQPVNGMEIDRNTDLKNMCQISSPEQIPTTWLSVLEILKSLLRKHETVDSLREKLLNIRAVNACLKILLHSLLLSCSRCVIMLHYLSSSNALSFFCQQVIAILQELVSAVCDFTIKLCLTTDINAELFKEIVELCSLLIYAQDILPLTVAQYEIICSIVSFPWIDTNVRELHDLTCDKFSQQRVKSWRCVIKSDAMIYCLQCLSFFPLTISPGFRRHVLMQCMNNENDEGVRIAALEVIPNLVYTNVLSSEDLYSVYRRMTQEKNINILKSFSRNIGKLSCVLSTFCIMSRDKKNDKSLQLLPELKCRTCDNGKIADMDDLPLCQMSQEATWLPSAVMFLLNHDSVEVCKETLSILPSVLTHLELNVQFLSCVINLLTDTNSQIHFKFRNCAKYLLKSTVKKNNTWTSEMDDILFNKLKAALHQSKIDNNIRMQEFLLSVTGEIATTAHDNLVYLCIIILLENLLSQVPSVHAVSQFELKKISDAKHLRMIELFKMFCQPICKFLAEYLLVCLSKNITTAEGFFYVIYSVFGYNDAKSFLLNTQQYILPYLICGKNSCTSDLLTLLSNMLGVEKREMLIDCFAYIFTHLACHCSNAELEKTLNFVQNETELLFGNLLRCTYQQCHNELLLRISTHYEQVYKGLNTLSLKSDEHGGRQLTSREDLAIYLKPRILGFLVFFDSYLLKSDITLDDKKTALKSLIKIIELMGKQHITAVRFKVMATLRIALRFKDKEFPKICCCAWNAFVHNIDIACLGTLLNQVAVSLLPLLEVESAAVADILRFLIVENKFHFKEFFHDLYFIPNMPELGDINSVLKEYTESSLSQTDFRSLLCHSLKGVSHENLEVRLYALAKLTDVLTANQASICQYIEDRESIDPLFSHIVSVVLHGCRDSDSRSRTLIAECLGSLGAIDPGRLEVKSINKSRSSVHFHSSISDEDFAFALIQELVRSYLAAADCRIQDCSAYALQEVLKIYKCTDAANSSENENSLWARFSSDVREILAIFLHSQYKSVERKRQFDKPIYQSRYGANFKDWVTNWYCDLYQKVKQEFSVKLFNSCSVIIKYDLSCALFLLPYLVLHALTDGTENEMEEITSEILAVLKHNDASTSDLCHLSSQTIFSILDYLNYWVRQQQMKKTVKSSVRLSGKIFDGEKYAIVNGFLTKIPEIILAKSSHRCQAYTRSLMYLEQHLKKNPTDLESNIVFLQKIYAALDEADGVAGVAAVRTEEPDLKDLTLEHEVSGDMQSAFACYEKLIKICPEDVSYHANLLKCFIGMYQPATALTYANGLVNKRSHWKEAFNSVCIEAAWQLANWDALDSLLKNGASEENWSVGVGKLINLAYTEDVVGFKQCLKTVRYNQMVPLSAASMEKGAYLRGYEYLTRLHMLSDFQLCIQAFLLNKTRSYSENVTTVDKVILQWKKRLELVQSSPRYQEPILDLHRVLLKMGKMKHISLSTKFDQEIATCWLKSAKLARKNGFQQRAYSCLLEASVVNSPSLFIEKSKWHWSKNEREEATNCLKKGIEEHFPHLSQRDANGTTSYAENLSECAKAKLLLAMYCEESAIADSNKLIQMYQDVVNLQLEWEASYFHLGKYYDKMLNAIENQETGTNLMIEIAYNFVLSLKYGCKHIYHSLPRLLDLWFTVGTKMVQYLALKKASPLAKNIEAALQKFNTVVIPLLYKSLPLFLLLTAFPQMVSRICHSHPEVSSHLQKIIAKLLATYPQQSMWMMIAVSKSSYSVRVERCKQIFHEAISLQPDLHKFIRDTTKLAEKLIELSNRRVVDSNTLSISDHFQILPKMVEERNFSLIMIPLQSQMIVTLPSEFASCSTHNPFPFTPIYIQGFVDTVEIFQSLQRPKKLTIRGSDGNLYGIICKPKDDLRKDCRLMEFNNLVNRYLKRDPEARKRQLYIRTYAVIPLNEECGLIEWVPNLSGLRAILINIYKQKGLHVTGHEIKAMMPHQSATAEQKLHIFKTKFLPRFPPVFSEWFLSTFPDPTTWYLARFAYARTTAVMSMVGYIVGLGDRHGENILFDSSCGDTVHVDLNCLFNKGETMACPECVPFRLTHNMINAMGPTRYEGIYRKACEVTMKVMRSQTDALMSVLRPFVHDPLVEWSKTSRNSRAQPPSTGEITNEMGLTHVRDIEQRLNGIIKAKNKPQGLPLSVEGQVNYLIQEATDEKNLSQMYIGWAAYM